MGAILNMSNAFRWGSRDCATLAADHVRALTGSDPMADLRGLYADARSAARLIAAEGGLVAAVGRRIGWPEAAPDAAEVAVLDARPAPALAIRQGAFWALPARDGVQLIRADLVTPLAAWGPA